MWPGPTRSGAQFCHLLNQKLPLLFLNDVLLLWKVMDMVTMCGWNLKEKWRNGWGWERDATRRDFTVGSAIFVFWLHFFPDAMV